MEISIIGAGRLGGALALALSKKNYTIRQLMTHHRDISAIANLISPPPEILSALSAKELAKLSADVVFITTPDSQIEALAQALAEKLTNKPFVFHTSGALSSQVLQPLKDIGCRAGSLHPLVSVSDPVAGAESFCGAFFCIEGDSAAVTLAEQFIKDLEGTAFTVPTEFKTLYHASAVMASGHLIALLSLAVEMLATCGLSQAAAQKILLPLVESTVKNLSSQFPARALTGPFARADVETIKLHLETLRRNTSAETQEIYQQLGARSLHLAEEQGAEKENLAEMRKYLFATKDDKIKS